MCIINILFKNIYVCFVLMSLNVNKMELRVQVFRLNVIEKWKQKSLSQVRLCDPMDYTVHGILQARILEWVAFPSSRGSFQPRDWTQVSSIAGRFFTIWATREAQEHWNG